MWSFFRFHEVNIFKAKFLCQVLCLTLTPVRLRSVSVLLPIATIHYFITEPSPNSRSSADFYSIVDMLLNHLNGLMNVLSSGMFCCTVTLDSRAQVLFLLLMSLQHWVTFSGGRIAVDLLHYSSKKT